MLLIFQISRDDIQVRFFEKKNNLVTWEAFGDFKPSHVHKQAVIFLRPPGYHTLDIKKPVDAYVQLLRPSDGATSDPLPFKYLPLVPRCLCFYRNLSEEMLVKDVATSTKHDIDEKLGEKINSSSKNIFEYLNNILNRINNSIYTKTDPLERLTADMGN